MGWVVGCGRFPCYAIYCEYDGDDFARDMAKLDKEPRNIEWLKVCDPMLKK